MGSKSETFSDSGPVYLATTTLDWQNPDHRRSIAASLVQGVYTLEGDRQKNREGPKALAPTWWESFGFELILPLVDIADGSIFGAIFEYKNLPSYGNHLVQKPPTYAVAFRGTLVKLDTIFQDGKLDIQSFLNLGRIQHSTRVQLAKDATEDMVARVGAANIWLVGHSLGSFIALQAGKHMAEKRCFVETYLFNPPYFSTQILDLIKNEELKDFLRFGKRLLTAEIAILVNGLQNDDSFAVLADWMPHLFVNESDYICNGYITHFEPKLKGEMGLDARKIERLAKENSVRSLLLNRLGCDSKPSHLIPSAYLTVTQSPSKFPLEAHKIKQWWQPYIQCQFKQFHTDLMLWYYPSKQMFP